jgi:hypothetical protein
VPSVKKIEPPQEPEPRVSKWGTVRAYYDNLLDGFCVGDYGQIELDDEKPTTIKQGLQSAASRRGLQLVFLHQRGRAVFRVVERAIEDRL